MISKELKFLLTHSSIYGLGTIVSRLVAFVLLPLYTRYLTPADYGILETIDISTAMIGLIVTMGIARALSRFYYIPEEQKEQNVVVSTTYIIYSLIALPFIPILIFSSEPLSNILFNSHEYSQLFIISFTTLLLGGLVDIGMMYLRLIKKPIIFVSITTVRLILLISLNVLFIVHFKMGVIGILYSSLLVRALFAILITFSILIKTKIRFSFKLSLDMVKYGLPMIPSELANTAVKQSDKFFVLYILSVADMGIYSLALKLGNALHSLLTIPFNMAYIPRRFEIMKRPDASETYAKIFTYYIFIISFFGLFISVLIPEILHFMVTPEFRTAGKIIPLVALSMIIFGCHYHFDFGILYSKKTKYLAYINISCAILNLCLNYCLINSFGLFGAVWAAIIILSLQAFLLYHFSEKYFHIEYEFIRIIKYLLIAFCLYGISAYIHNDTFLILLTMKLCLLSLFPIIVILLRIISHEETTKLKELYKTKIRSRLFFRPTIKHS